MADGLVTSVQAVSERANEARGDTVNVYETRMSYGESQYPLCFGDTCITGDEVPLKLCTGDECDYLTTDVDCRDGYVWTGKSCVPLNTPCSTPQGEDPAYRYAYDAKGECVRIDECSDGHAKHPSQGICVTDCGKNMVFSIEANSCAKIDEVCGSADGYLKKYDSFGECVVTKECAEGYMRHPRDSERCVLQCDSYSKVMDVCATPGLPCGDGLVHDDDGNCIKVGDLCLTTFRPDLDSPGYETEKGITSAELHGAELKWSGGGRCVPTGKCPEGMGYSWDRKGCYNLCEGDKKYSKKIGKCFSEGDFCKDEGGYELVYDKNADCVKSGKCSEGYMKHPRDSARCVESCDTYSDTLDVCAEKGDPCGSGDRVHNRAGKCVTVRATCGKAMNPNKSYPDDNELRGETSQELNSATLRWDSNGSCVPTGCPKNMKFSWDKGGCYYDCGNNRVYSKSYEKCVAVGDGCRVDGRGIRYEYAADGSCRSTGKCAGNKVMSSRTKKCEDVGSRCFVDNQVVEWVHNSAGNCVTTGKCANGNYVYAKTAGKCVPKNSRCKTDTQGLEWLYDSNGRCVKTNRCASGNHVFSREANRCVQRNTRCRVDNKGMEWKYDGNGNCKPTGRCSSGGHVYSNHHGKCVPIKTDCGVDSARNLRKWVDGNGTCVARPGVCAPGSQWMYYAPQNKCVAVNAVCGTEQQRVKRYKNGRCEMTKECVSGAGKYSESAKKCVKADQKCGVDQASGRLKVYDSNGNCVVSNKCSSDGFVYVPSKNGCVSIGQSCGSEGAYLKQYDNRGACVKSSNCHPQAVRYNNQCSWPGDRCSVRSGAIFNIDRAGKCVNSYKCIDPKMVYSKQHSICVTPGSDCGKSGVYKQDGSCVAKPITNWKCPRGLKPSNFYHNVCSQSGTLAGVKFNQFNSNITRSVHGLLPTDKVRFSVNATPVFADGGKFEVWGDGLAKVSKSNRNKSKLLDVASSWNTGKTSYTWKWKNTRCEGTYNIEVIDPVKSRSCGGKRCLSDKPQPQRYMPRRGRRYR